VDNGDILWYSRGRTFGAINLRNQSKKEPLVLSGFFNVKF
jgi:hypothetical protein